ncbi:MAG: DUF3299 domain-containing protein [Pseudomonadota bacterium]
MRLAALAVAFIFAALTPVSADEPMILEWEDLMPEGEWERIEQQIMEMFGDMPGGVDSIAEGSAGDTAVQFGTFNVVNELNDENIRMPGYALPLEFAADGVTDEFLLVPYFGACIHTPPPPPNQIVYVKSEKPIKLAGLWDPIWVEGVLKTTSHNNDLGNAAYTLILDKTEPYQF